MGQWGGDAVGVHRARALLPRRLRPALPLGGGRVGVEHEFRLTRGVEAVDARVLLPTLRLDGARLDPGDPLAVRCAWGGVITADGKEAEVATPPFRADGDGVRRVVDAAATGRAVLAAALPDDIAIEGYSTHLNVEIEDRLCRPAALIAAHRLSPALMLLDRRESPGLLIRPRHRRLEFGGDHIEGVALCTALVMAVGATLVAERAASSSASRRCLPPELQLRIVPSPQRFGWYVDRAAGGDDLYELGRSCTFRTRDGATITAQEVLERTWELARSAVTGLLSADDIALVDDTVRGDRPLPSEAEPSVRVEPVDAGVAFAASVVHTRQRGDVELTVVTATWHAIVVRARCDGRERFIRVPGERADDFLRSVDAGELDEWLHEQFPRHRSRVSAR